MKKLIIATAILFAFAAPSIAKNFAVPAKNPAVTLVVPDNWKTEEIEYGFSAKSPDGDVFFSAESASAKSIDALLENNNKWMKENKIKLNVQPDKREMDFNGTKGEVLTYETTDENGPTIINFVLLEGGKNTMIMLTLWASPEERKANKAGIDALMNSIKPIK